MDKQRLQLLPQSRYRLEPLKVTSTVCVGTFTLARESRGHTRREAAAEMGIPVERLRTIERGTGHITGDELATLAEFYHYPPAFFRREFEDFDGLVFVCGDYLNDVEPCALCGEEADCLCDFPMGKGKTCDLPLCQKHRKRVQGEPDEDDDPDAIDYCPQHALMTFSEKPTPSPPLDTVPPTVAGQQARTDSLSGQSPSAPAGPPQTAA